MIADNSAGPLFGAPLFELELDLSLGIDAGEPDWQVFGRRIAFNVSPDGRMYIFNIPNTLGAFVVSPRGELIRTMLPPGAGPGEARGAMGAWWVDEGREQWVWDRQLHRLNRLNRDGDLIETVPLAHRADEWRSLYQLTDRRFLGSRPARDPEGIGKQITEYGTLSEDFAWKRTILRMEPSKIEPGFYRSGPVEIGLPFSAVNFFVTFPSGLIAWGDTDTGIVTLLESTGDVRARFRVGHGPEPVTKKDRERFLFMVAARNERDLPAARRARLPDRWGAFWWPETDDRDRIWIPRGKPHYEGMQQVGWIYDVYDSSGRWLGTQELPVPHNELQIQNGFLYMAINSDDRGPRLHRYRMRALYEGLRP